MPSQTKENYLKAIYALQQKTDKVSITQLGREMAVSKPTVNSMIKKLTDKGWVDYKPYKPISLTDTGYLQAAMIVRKHRLTEMFLVQIMGFGWEEVHSIAEEMEHVQSEPFFDRMDELLGYPTSDPHGSPIPDRLGDIDRASYQKLSDVPIGSTVVLRAVGDSSAGLLVLLNAKGIALGTQITLTHVEKFDQSITIDYADKVNINISNEVARRLLVEALQLTVT